MLLRNMWSNKCDASMFSAKPTTTFHSPNESNLAKGLATLHSFLNVLQSKILGFQGYFQNNLKVN